MTILRSDDWSNAHFTVNELLGNVLHLMRDLGYNPSQHIEYNHESHLVEVDAALLTQHEQLQALYTQYREACKARDAALEKIQTMPKLDLGFEQQTSRS